MTTDEKRSIVASLVQTIFLRKTNDGRKWGGRLSPEKRAGYLESLRRRFHVVWVTDPDVDVPRPGGRGNEPKPFQFPAG